MEDSELEAVWNLAPPILRCAIELAIMTSLRLGDILRLNIRDNIRKERLYVETGKTRKKLLFTWSHELRNLVERCKALRGKVSSLYLICTRDGQKYTEDGFKSMWQRVMRKALAESVIKDRFSFNDLRAKAASDAEPANAPDLLGHDDPRTTNRIYRRAPRRVTPILTIASLFDTTQKVGRANH